MKARRATLILTPLLMLVGMELAVWLAEPTRPTLRTLDGREVGTISDILKFAASEPPRRHPGTRIKPLLQWKACYDGKRRGGFDADGCVEYRTNAFGFRDDDFPFARPAGELRLLAVGDSFTFGAGVQFDDIWVQRLERGLAQACARPVQVINGGFAGGIEPKNYLPWLASDGVSFQPDVVLVAMTLNDMGSVPMTSALGWPEPPAGLHLLALAERTWWMWKASSEPPTDWGEMLRRHPQKWRATQQALRRIRKLLDENGVRLVVAVFPMLTDLDGKYPYGAFHEAAVSFCHDNGIEVIDLLGAVLGRKDSDLWVHPDDQHPNTEAHRLFSEALLVALGPSLRKG